MCIRDSLVWGQPRAWTDELISVWVIEHLAATYGQAIVQVDCLASQWTSAVLLKAWSESLIWCPLAPDSTSYLQEPDTHEHSQLKAIVREEKGKMHFQLEAEFKKRHKDMDYVANWGPYEMLHIMGSSLKSFKTKYPRVPLEGMMRNNMLVVRPSSSSKSLEIVSDEGPWQTYKLPPSRGIPPQAASDRIILLNSWIGEGGKAPKPDWSLP